MTEITLQSKATPTDEGFAILAISEGEAKGHGITFNGNVLLSAAPMYEARPVFIDHADIGNSPSVRNLAGTLHGATWDESERGIRATLKPSGPAADVLLAVRDAAKSDPAIMQAVGFSTVLHVKLDKQGNVTKIVHVKSVDVVIDPARGGKFLSRHSAGQKESTMSDESTTQQGADDLNAERQAALNLQGAADTIAALQAQAEQGNEILLAQCATLLDTSLTASKLPTASQKVLRKAFEARIFKATELQAAIEDKREELAELHNASIVTGPGRAQSMGGFMHGPEQFRLAVYDLFGVPRDEKDKNVRVHRLAGINEAYRLGTGDLNFYGGFYPEFALGGATTDFAGIVADVQNKILLQAWEDFRDSYGWWEQIVKVEHLTNLNDIKWIKTGTIGSLPTVTESGEYLELPIGDNKETSSWTKYGGYIPLTIEAVLRDDLKAFQSFPREVALGAMRNISEQIAYIFTQNSAAGPNLADTGALFNSTAVTTAGGHANLLTTALGTDYTAWKAVSNAMYKQSLLVKNAAGYYGTGKRMAIRPKFCLVPVDLYDQAADLFVTRQNSLDNKNVENRFFGQVYPIAVPEWTDATDWAAVIDPKLVPGVMLGEIFGVKPQIYNANRATDAAMFANDEYRLKVRQFLNVGVADFRPLHKSNVA